MYHTCSICLESVVVEGECAPCGFASAFFHRGCLQAMREYHEQQDGGQAEFKCPHCNIVVPHELKIYRIKQFLKRLFVGQSVAGGYYFKKMSHQSFCEGLMLEDMEKTVVQNLLTGILQCIHEFGNPDGGVFVFRGLQDPSITYIRFRQKRNPLSECSINVCRLALTRKQRVYSDGFEVSVMRKRLYRNRGVNHHVLESR